MNFENHSVDSIENKEENKSKKVENSNQGQEFKEDKEAAENLSQECLRHMKSGEDVCNALKEIGQDTAYKGLEKRQKEWDDSSRLLSGMSRFSNLENAPDEELDEEYLKNFESQSGTYYLGSLVAALDSAAFKSGFFNAYHNKPTEEMPADLLKNINIVERLIEASKRVNARSEKIKEVM